MHSGQADLVLLILIPTILFFAAASGAQDFPVKKPQEKTSRSSSPMGMATGAAHAPVTDAKSRPITAGGFVGDAPVVFLDISSAGGLRQVSPSHGHSGKGDHP
jgi:hypothetical protein